MAPGRPDLQWASKVRASAAFCLVGIAAGTGLYFSNLAYVRATGLTAWLRHAALEFSPQVSIAAGFAIVGPGGRRVAFPPLLVDVHEVSNQQYRDCVQAHQCAPPVEPANDADYATGDRSLPVVGVTAYDAAQFCTWLGRRLPTEPEWERIARGTDGKQYPWGNTPPRPGQVNAIVGGHRPHGLVPADSPAFASGDSPAGVEQLIGNVQEWTATQASITPSGAVVLHGSWNGQALVPGLAVIGGGYLDQAVTVENSLIAANPASSDSETGFRCVATAILRGGYASQRTAMLGTPGQLPGLNFGLPVPRSTFPAWDTPGSREAPETMPLSLTS